MPPPILESPTGKGATKEYPLGPMEPPKFPGVEKLKVPVDVSYLTEFPWPSSKVFVEPLM